MRLSSYSSYIGRLQGRILVCLAEISVMVALCSASVLAQESPADKFDIKPDKSLNGTTFVTWGPIQSTADCVNTCAKDSKCAAFTYKSDKKLCDLKFFSQFSQGTESGVTSGILRPTDEDVYALSHYEIADNQMLQGNIIKIVGGMLTPAKCAAACSKDRNCRSFTYVKASQKCEFKDENAFVDAITTDFISGTSKSVDIMRSGKTPPAKQKDTPPKRSNLGNLVCTTKDVSISDSFDSNFVGSKEAMDTSLYPGAMFYLNDVLSGSFNTVNSSTALDYTIYVKFNDLANTSATIDENMEPATEGDPDMSRVVAPTAKDVNNGIASIVRANPFLRNISSSFQVDQIFSDEQINIALRGGATYNGFSMKGSFDFDSNSTSSKHIAQLFQRYYAVSVDNGIDNGVGGWIGDTDQARRIEAEQATRGPLVFIETVVYGRALYFFNETSKSDLEVKAELEAAYDGAYQANAEASAKLKRSMATDKLRVIQIGSDLKDAVIDSFDEFVQRVKEGVPATGRGAPIAYVLRFVDDKSLAMVHINTSYPQRVCTKLKNKLRFAIKGITTVAADDEGTDNAIEIRAPIFVNVTYDTYPQGSNTAVEVSDPANSNSVDVLSLFRRKQIFLGNESDGGDLAVGEAGAKTELNRFVDFEIPDDPHTEEVNEALTARVHIVFAGVEEVDGSSANDPMPPLNGTADSFKTVVLQDFRIGPGEGFQGLPFSEFKGGGHHIRIHYALESVD